MLVFSFNVLFKVLGVDLFIVLEVYLYSFLMVLVGLVLGIKSSFFIYDMVIRFIFCWVM